jgi:hypothetical protein
LDLKGKKTDRGENYIMMNFTASILHRILLGYVARMGEGRVVYRVLFGRPEGKRSLGRPRHRWEYNIKMDLREIGIYGANWIQLAQDKVQWRACVNTVMNLWVPQESRIFFGKLSDSQLYKYYPAPWSKQACSKSDNNSTHVTFRGLISLVLYELVIFETNFSH